MTVQVQGPDGALVEFPDGTPPEVMTRALRQHYGGPPEAAPVDRPAVNAEGRPKVYIDGAPPAAEATPTGPSAMHSLAVGAQGVGAGVRDIALMPFDLAAGAQNLVTGGINKLFGTNIPAATPASQMVEHATAPFAIPESDMSSGERLGYNINRFGTQGLGMGTMLAARAPAVAEAAKPAADFVGRTLDTLARPYTAAPAKVVAGDAVSGIGSGAAVDAAEKYLPQEPTTTTGQVVKGAANFMAPLLGGVGATTAMGVSEGLGGAIRNMANKRRTDTNIPFGENGQSFSRSDSERAARDLQSRATGNPDTLAKDIRENATELANPTKPGEVPVEPSQMPTSGLLSRDPGLVTAETGARMKKHGDFVARDQAVKEAAATRVDSLRDPNADQSVVPRVARDARESQMAPVEQRVQQVEDVNRQIGDIRQRQGAEFGAIANSEAKANASRNLDRTVVDEGYIPARTEKNRQFDNAPGRHEQLPADDVFAAIDRVRRGANDLAPGTMPHEFMQRLDRLRPRIDETSGENVGGPGTALGGDLADLRKYLNTAQESAQRGGNFDLADNISTLRRSINSTIGDAPGYAEANANYGQFADRYRPERNDEMAKFTREIDRGGMTDGAPNRGNTPPTETASRFLSSPEKTQALQRVLDGAPNATAGQAAVRDYMRSDFASAALNSDGTLNPARASAWSRNNADVLAQFPRLRTEFDGYVQAAQRGEQVSTQARTALDEVRKTRKTTEAEIDRSAVGTLLKEDPRDVAKSLLNGGYNSEKRLSEIQSVVKNDPEAARGWKAAVSEVLTDKVTSSRVVGETKEIQFARLAKEFKDNEALLTKVYTPEEMNTLRQGHKLLEYFKEAEKRATVGSQTAERVGIPGAVQLAVRHVYGDLRGGGIIKRFKLLLEQIPTNKANADEIVHMSWFNPDVAAYLLEKPIKNGNVPMHNVDLRRLLAVDNAARESGH